MCDARIEVQTVFFYALHSTNLLYPSHPSQAIPGVGAHLHTPGHHGDTQGWGAPGLGDDQGCGGEATRDAQECGGGPPSLGLLERDNMYDITTFNFNTMAHVFYNA